MMNSRNKKRSAWQRLTSFPRSFSYEVDVPLEDVVQNLADLEQEHQILGRDSQEVSILPRRDHYAFRLRRRRHGTLAASAEGEVWENAAGRVVVEGEARSNGGLMFIILLVLLIPMLIFTISFQHLFSIFPLIIFFGAITIDFILLHRSRQTMISQIGRSISNLNGASQQMLKPKRQIGERLALADELPAAVNDWQGVEAENMHHREHDGG